MQRKLNATLVWCAALAACNDPPVLPGDPPEFTLSPAKQWSGGEVEIVSSYFSAVANPLIRLDTSLVSARRINDSTFAATIPSTFPSGFYQIIVRSNSGPVEAGTVQVFGYRDSQTNPVALSGYLTVGNLPQGPFILGTVGPQSLLPGAIDLVSGNLTTFAGLSSIGQESIGPSFRGPDVALLFDSTGQAGEWKLFPQPALLDSAPGITGPRLAAALGPRSYLTFTGKWATMFFPGERRDFLVESASRVYLSPGGTRATVTASVTDPGIPVFNMQTGDTAYTLPLRLSAAATFSSDGSRLFALGGNGGAPHVYTANQLYVIEATTGAILAHDSLPLPVLDGYALALDLSETLLFVSASVGTVPRVLVYDASTLNHLGTLDVPNSSCAGWCVAGAVAVDESQRTIYLAVPGDTLTIHRFDLLR